MKIIGHRGAKGLAPENTLASFAEALKHNVAEIECDVRVTKDGVAVLEHDNKLETADGAHYEVSEFTLDELVKLKPELPTVEQAIAFADKRSVVHLEVKPREAIEPVIAAVQTYLDKGWSVEHFIISSRDYKLLKQVRRLAPQLPVSVIQPWSGIIAVWRARRLGTKRISMNEHVMWPGFIRSLSRRGYQLCGYTMDDPVRAERWAKHGLYAAITDHPERFQAK